MNVAVIGTRGFPQIEGGVEKHCEEMYPLLPDDMNVRVYRRKPFVKGDGVYKNISFVDLPSTKIKGFEAVLHSFLATVHALFHKPDVVHFHNIGPAMFCPLLKLRKIPIVLTFHSPNYEHKKWGKFAKNLLLFSEKIALKSSDAIIFVNRFQMEKYEEAIQKKSIYISNGVKPPVFSPNTDFLEKLGVVPRKYILSVGRITPEKGFDTLIKAFIRAQLSDMKLVIAGSVQFESAYGEQLRQLVGSHDVIFAGHVSGDPLAQLYTYADRYVLSSHQEGFPLVLLEAMSYQLPVLASDIPAAHLVDLADECYFPAGDDQALAEKLKSLGGHPLNVSYDMNAYDWARVAESVAAVYRGMMEK